MLEVGQGDKFIQVPQTLLILGEEDHMECLSLLIVFYEVCLYTVYDLDPVFLPQPVGFRKNLNHSVVCNGNCGMAPVSCLCNRFLKSNTESRALILVCR